VQVKKGGKRTINRSFIETSPAVTGFLLRGNVNNLMTEETS